VAHDDTDDFDAGVFPGSTSETGGVEGGNVLGALRGWCSGKAGLEKDGKAPRDVDHDGDKLPASQDGCPDPKCDVDGDGFPGPQCNPPAAIADCDDNDPQTFPGAPDKCGDGKAQNCVSDTSCACDADGDGYCPPADCDDKDPAVHPWATEVCNGKDDDCDGLIDEANPDPSGKPMSTSTRACNDSNVGYCGDCKWANTEKPAPSPPDVCGNAHLLSGLCVCSPTTPKATYDPGNNRVACVGENLGAKASPRCIGARQPDSKEHCASGDFNCDGHDVQPGEDFLDKGTNCSVAVGECTVGKVTDCNLNSPVPNFNLIKAVDPTFNQYWVCDGKLPKPEICNGRDDDCNGSPGSGEADQDGDGWLPCRAATTPCSPSSPGAETATTATRAPTRARPRSATTRTTTATARRATPTRPTSARSRG